MQIIPSTIVEHLLKSKSLAQNRYSTTTEYFTKSAHYGEEKFALPLKMIAEAAPITPKNGP